VYIRISPIDFSSKGTGEELVEGASASSRPTGTMDKESFEEANCTKTHLNYFYVEDGGCMYLRNITNTAHIHTISRPGDQYQQRTIAKA
jgi:hypothetical protein